MSIYQILVAGGGGFIGGHLVAKLRTTYPGRVRSVDVKPMDEWYQVFDDVDNQVLDLRLLEACKQACADVSWVYNLAADMGGMGFIENNKSLCMLNVLIDTHLLQAAHAAGATRFFYSSTACVYNINKQNHADIEPLREGDAYPAMPEDGYGWQKLFSERMCRHFHEDFGLETRIARFHNVYGPHGTWDGGREKAPAAICRKVIEAQETGKGEIEIWGDGTRTRSFMYIDDCIEGIERIMTSDVTEPLNLGSNKLVTINELVKIVEGIANITLERKHDMTAPQGVHGRNSDNTLIQEKLGWQPNIPLTEGLAHTYAWILEQYRACARSK